MGKETEILQGIRLGELEEIENIKSSVRQHEREKTAAKQQHWNEIAAYNKAQKQLREEKIAKHQRQLREQRIAKNREWDRMVANDKISEDCVDYDNILLEFQKSYNRTLIALEYADYCLEHDYRYNFTAETDWNTALQINLDLSTEETIALKKENQALRERIAELETERLNCTGVLTKANGYIVGEIIG